MLQLIALLAGKKTYITAFVYAALAFMKAVGVEVPGFEVGPAEAVFQAAGLASLRAGVAKQ